MTPSRSSPATSETRCVMCEKRSGSRKRSTRTVPGRQTRERSLRPRSTSMTCSARSFSELEQRLGVTVARRDRAGDRVQLGARALALDDRLRRRADQREPVQLEQEQVRRRVDPPQRAVELQRRRGRRPLCALRDDDLECIARADVLLRRSHAPLVLRLVGEAAQRAALAVAARHRRQRPVERGGIAVEDVGDSARRGRSERACRRRRSGSPARPGPSSGSGTVGSSFATWS